MRYTGIELTAVTTIIQVIEQLKMELNTPEKTLLLSNFDIDYEYGDVICLDNFNYILVFSKERLSTKTVFLAKAYDKKGNFMFVIPFPYVEVDHKKINLIYGWTSEIDDELRIVFYADNRIMHDFWYAFDLVQRKYTSHGRAY
ncbi:hypothetical protein [Psychrobacter alimentarius]|uniref:hypothetical protein n=1 Tax=Psychrobacter alimentarius TaxID=261164 RepID=UPI0031069ECD